MFSSDSIPGNFHVFFTSKVNFNCGFLINLAKIMHLFQVLSQIFWNPFLIETKKTLITTAFGRAFQGRVLLGSEMFATIIISCWLVIVSLF
jgi:hypothetical protein